MNNNGYKWVIGILIILNIFSLSALWMGHLKYRGERDKFHNQRDISDERRGDSGFLPKELDLDPEQAKNIKALRKEHQNQMMEIQKTIHQKKKQFIEEAFAEEVNDSALNSLINELGQLQIDLEQINKEHIIKMRENFNPEQLVRFKRLFGEMIMRADPDRGHHVDFIKGERRKSEKREKR